MRILKCEICGLEDEKLLVRHHRDKNHKNNSKLNIQILCWNCHVLQHRHMQSRFDVSKAQGCQLCKRIRRGGYVIVREGFVLCPNCCETYWGLRYDFEHSLTIDEAFWASEDWSLFEAQIEKKCLDWLTILCDESPRCAWRE